MGKDPEIIAERRGMPVYRANPSIAGAIATGKQRRRQLGDEHKGLVIDDGSGEVLGRGTAVAYEWEEVDDERFVKLYLGGVKQAARLTRAGLVMFEMVYSAVQERPGSDKIELSFLTAGKSKTTYYNGIRELLEKGLIYNSPFDGVFFVNIQHMFNGDRLAFVKAYYRKSSKRGKRRPVIAASEAVPASPAQDGFNFDPVPAVQGIPMEGLEHAPEGTYDLLTVKIDDDSHEKLARFLSSHAPGRRRAG